MTAPDAREETIRRVIERDGRHPPVPSAEHPDPPMALAALASLVRDARRAVLGEAVVEAAYSVAHDFYSESGEDFNEKMDALGEALAAFRAEHPAEPQGETA